MSVWARVILGLIVAFGLTGTAAQAAWHRATNSHFIIYADMPAADLQRYGDRLERFDAAMRLITRARQSTPVTIYMVRDLEEVQRLIGQRNVGGFYRGQAQEPLIVVPLDTGARRYRYQESAEAVLLHEYAHHMLLSNVDQFLPSWANEGMAEFFMSAQFQPNGGIVLGAPNESRGFSMFSMNRWTAKQLLLSETRAVKSDEIVQRYARGWLLVHYLLLSGEREGQYTRYIAALNAGTPTEKAATEVFGDLGKLDGDLQRYLRRPRFQGLQIEPGKLTNLQKVAVAPLPPGAAAIMPYRITSANGVTAQTARPLAARARPVAARFPDDPYVQRTLAEIEFDAKDYARATAAADRAIAADPANVMALVYRGRIVAEQAREKRDAAKWKEARGWFLKANKANPDHAQPFVSYYDSFGAAGEKPPAGARTGLLRALVLTPQDESLHARVGLMHLREGDLKAARAALGVAAFNPHAGPDNPARRAVALMDEQKSADAIVAAVGEKLTINELVPPSDDDKEDAKTD